MCNQKEAICRFVKGQTDDAGNEAIKLFLPVNNGYVNYNIVHSVNARSNCDTWRLSVAYWCDDKLSPIKPLTRAGAEWEMALKIQQRPDFIGGYAHGDEVFQKVKLTVDEKEREFEAITELIPFRTLVLEVWSKGFDPIDSVTEALLHYKKITVSNREVSVEQKVEWLNDYLLGNSYMAMMPPFKEVTDHYYTDADADKKPISVNVSISESGLHDTLYLCGESGFTFGMKVGKSLSGGENRFLITDNGGVPYNKMYFLLDHSGSVKKGNAWETCTVYTIKN
ncbi:MAG: hypothetical protein IJY39_04235 [Clostridia bacterium]|nr:hypothetical protein [Clostridia bacterium]